MSDLEHWMRAAGHTDATLAERVGVSRVQISRIKRGLSKPSPALAARLEAETGISAWSFIAPAAPQGAAA